MLHLHNTLSRQKEAFTPLEPGKVGLYVCGITVYDYCHIGHARVIIVYDMLYRHLLASGFDVNYVRNITDVEDKIIARAAELNETESELTGRFINIMHEDAQALGALPPSTEPRATDNIELMVTLIGRLVDSGHAYPAANGDVYYAIKSFADYGKLSGRKLDELRAGERVAVDENKRDPLDFVLWKAARPGDPSWASPWGAGRPGWHIECSAMAMDKLGEQFDIHGGGSDLIFPHHENEIAQSEACTGKQFANVWMHNGLIRIGEEKMSKSLNNFFTIRDVLESYSGEEIRMFMLSSQYRSPLNFSTAQLDSARTSLRRLYNALRFKQDETDVQNNAARLESDQTYVTRFTAAMDDDLNTPEALAVLFELANALNRETSPDSESARRLATTLRKLGDRLGMLQADPQAVLQGVVSGDSGLSAEAIDALIAERVAARAQKDFARSDEIRDELARQGVQLEDAGGKTSWRRT